MFFKNSTKKKTLQLLLVDELQLSQGHSFYECYSPPEKLSPPVLAASPQKNTKLPALLCQQPLPEKIGEHFYTFLKYLDTESKIAG